MRNSEEYKEPSILEKELTIVTDWILGKYSMNKLPKNRKLKTLLDGYTKEKMMDFSDENGLEAERKWKKAELVDYLAASILENLEERLIILGEEILQLIHWNDKESFSNDSNDFVNFYILAFPAATRMGVLFSFEEDGEIINYVPEEVTEKLDEVIRNFSGLKKKYATKVRLWKEIETVIHAGVALYGLVSKGTIHDLWEIYKPGIKKFDVEERISKMQTNSSYIPLIAMRNNFYIINGHDIGSDMFAGEGEVERFFGNMPDISELGRYIPTKGDLKEYIKHSFDRRVASYKKLKQLVSKQHLNIPFKNIMSYIETNIQLGKSLSMLIADIKRMGMLQFRTFKDVEKFTMYYTELNNHSRLWELRGHTPAEVSKMQDF